MLKKNRAGYTLIELLVVTGLLSLIVIGSSSLFINTLTHKIRLSTNQEIKLEGDYVIDQISFFIRNAQNIYDPCTGTSLRIQNSDGNETTFRTISAAGITRVASASATYTSYLSSSEYLVDELNFDCQSNPNNQRYVTISLVLTRNLATTTDPISRSFQHTVLQRNSSAQ